MTSIWILSELGYEEETPIRAFATFEQAEAYEAKLTELSIEDAKDWSSRLADFAEAAAAWHAIDDKLTQEEYEDCAKQKREKHWTTPVVAIRPRPEYPDYPKYRHPPEFRITPLEFDP